MTPMTLLVSQLLGGIAGLLLGVISVSIYQRYENRRHARDCLRRFDAHVALLKQRRAQLDAMLERERAQVTRADQEG